MIRHIFSLTLKLALKKKERKSHISRTRLKMNYFQIITRQNKMHKTHVRRKAYDRRAPKQTVTFVIKYKARS